MDRHLRTRALRRAFITRDGSTPWGLSPIERAGMSSYLESEYRHARLERWCQLIREANEWRRHAAT